MEKGVICSFVASPILTHENDEVTDTKGTTWFGSFPRKHQALRVLLHHDVAVPETEALIPGWQ